MKGDNTITGDEVSSYNLFCNQIKGDFDASVIIGLHKNNDKVKSGTLLLCRYHKFNPNLSKRKRQTTQKLFTALSKSLKNECLERKRLGGSSGINEYSHNLKLLMKTHNTSPRKSKGIFYCFGLIMFL